MKKARHLCAVCNTRKTVARNLCRADYEAAVRLVRLKEETWGSMSKKLGVDLRPTRRTSRLIGALREAGRRRSRRS